jgi:uncharacterized repeat protein (TIGR03803 family)
MNAMRIALTLAMISALLLIAARPAQAQTETVLYSFQGTPDGYGPYAGPLLKGTTLYGTTWTGGSADNGTVWSVSATTGKETILYSFQGQPNDGWDPFGGLAYYKGSFYGTTVNGPSGPGGGIGTVFKISKSGKKYVETILHIFTGPPDGLAPLYVTPVFDKQGNLYGTTSSGGEQGGSGIVFKLTPPSEGQTNWTETILHQFNLNNEYGFGPQSGVTLDKKGNLYGTTASGGTYGYGVLYEITAAGNYSVLYNFTGQDDGAMPYSPPVLDKKGNLYGTTEQQEPGFSGYGTVYKFDPKTSQMTILHTFSGYPDDSGRPWAGALVFDKEGNLYGTTSSGGYSDCGGVGTIYELAPDGTETILYNFNCTDGQVPLGSVVFDRSGNLYTTTSAGGAGTGGAVIKLTP